MKSLFVIVLAITGFVSCDVPDIFSSDKVTDAISKSMEKCEDQFPMIVSQFEKAKLDLSINHNETVQLNAIVEQIKKFKLNLSKVQLNITNKIATSSDVLEMRSVKLRVFLETLRIQGQTLARFADAVAAEILLYQSGIDYQFVEHHFSQHLATAEKMIESQLFTAFLGLLPLDADLTKLDTLYWNNNGTAAAKEEQKKLKESVIHQLQKISKVAESGQTQLLGVYTETMQKLRLTGKSLSLLQQMKAEMIADSMAYLANFTANFLEQFLKLHA